MAGRGQEEPRRELEQVAEEAGSEGGGPLSSFSGLAAMAAAAMAIAALGVEAGVGSGLQWVLDRIRG